jgi:hypothetical protein
LLQTGGAPTTNHHHVRPVLQGEFDRLGMIASRQKDVIVSLSEVPHDRREERNMRRVA